MKLLRCNIVNYGCLHDFSYEFQPGINQINQPNGWGKSTLASFLCAMLYGLDATTKRNIQENERKHYHPWQEGPFGGSLEFEISGREYRVERFFGLREREDTFTLYDLKTMQVSQDYSSHLGTELFGIDKTGYMHSTYIPQGKTSLEYNDTLAARLTKLNQSADDINQYEQAISEIDRALRFYVKTGRRGEIAILQREADTTEKQLQEALEANRQLRELTFEEKKLERQREQLNQQLADIQQQITVRTEQEIHARYNLLRSQLDQIEQKLDEMEVFFHDQLPDDNDIESYLLSCARLSDYEQQWHQEGLNELQMQDFSFLQIFFSSNDTDAGHTITDTASKDHANADTTSKDHANADTASKDHTNADTASKDHANADTASKDHANADTASKDHANADTASKDHANADTASENHANIDHTTEDHTDEDAIFTCRQKRLLIQSEQYHADAAILFSSDHTYTGSGYSSLPENPPDPEVIDRARQLYYQYRTNLNSQNEASKLSDSVAEQLHRTQDSLEQQDSVSDYKDIEDQDFPHQKSRYGFYPLLSAAIFLLAIGIFICCLWKPAIGLPVILSGIIFMAYIYLVPGKETPVGSKDQLRIHTEIYARLHEQILELQTQLDSYQNQSAAFCNAAESCLEQLRTVSIQLNLPLESSDCPTDDYLTQLAALDNQAKNYQQEQQRMYNLYRKQLAFYNQLKHKYENYNLCLEKQRCHEKQISDLRLDITQFLCPYFSITESETPAYLEVSLHELKSKLNTYKNLLSGRRAALQDLNSFLQEYPAFKIPADAQPADAQPADAQYELTDYDTQKTEEQTCSSSSESKDISSLKSLTMLHSEESAIREQYASCIQQISILQSHMEHLQETASESSCLEEKAFKLKQRIGEYTEHHRILSLTKQYLTKARHDFSENYLHSIEKNFNHYAHILQKRELLNADMNSDFHMLISDHGVLHETDWYSQGTRDLIDLCARFAIIEDLFTEESPFLILDDPFVNLDDQSLNQLSSILCNIADKWQVLYFTCHSSRTILL